MLTFDEAAHQYYWDGHPVLNTTRIIGHLTDYSHIPAAALERARQQGVHVHRMVELDCSGDLDVASLPEWMRGHYAAWCRFKEETGFQVWASERRMYHPAMRYAGTTDLVGELPKLKCVKGPANIDVKRSFYAGAAIGLQTASYTDLWNHNEPRSLHVPRGNRFALRLDADGIYRLQQFEDAEDFAAFLACLQMIRWREKHAI